MKDWFLGARPHTWANAFVPVIVGSCVATAFTPLHAVLAGIVSWALIVGVNYANDYSDGIKGTDDARTGPVRLVGQGRKAPAAVKRAAFISFGVAGVAGVAVSVLTQPWLILIGVVCVLAAWFYTGGKNPYGYRGLGEVAVFIFFGLVAVLGTQFLQGGVFTAQGVIAAVCVGAMSAAVNLANNLRDIPTDTAAGKITLAVRLGDANTRKLWLVLAIAPGILGALTLSPPLLLSSLAAARAAKPVYQGAKGKDLIPVLKTMGQAMLVFAAVLLTHRIAAGMDAVPPIGWPLFA